MINDGMENKTLNSVSDLEFNKNSVEMMRYRVNALSNKLCFGSLFCSIIAAFICLNSTNPITFAVILKIMLNIIILLGGFLCCEKAKNYSKEGSIALIVMGGVCIARIFWIPLQLLIYYPIYVNAMEAGDKATADNAAKYLGQTITGHWTGGLTRWITYSGTVRGIVAIVFLAAAAVLFIAAGLIGVKRSIKLNTYLDSLKK